MKIEKQSGNVSERDTLENQITEKLRAMTKYLENKIDNLKANMTSTSSSLPLQSEQVDEVYKAFSMAQLEFPSIAKASQGYGYKYANLAHILTAIIPILNKHGLAFIQFMSKDNILHTRIIHESGQYFESQTTIPLYNESDHGDNKRSYIQEIGSRRTYLRRYEALALLGLSPEADDDDNKPYKSFK